MIKLIIGFCLGAGVMYLNTIPYEDGMQKSFDDGSMTGTTIFMEIKE